MSPVMQSASQVKEGPRVAGNTTASPAVKVSAKLDGERRNKDDRDDEEDDDNAGQWWHLLALAGIAIGSGVVVQALFALLRAYCCYERSERGQVRRAAVELHGTQAEVREMARALRLLIVEVHTLSAVSLRLSAEVQGLRQARLDQEAKRLAARALASLAIVSETGAPQRVRQALDPALVTPLGATSLANDGYAVSAASSSSIASSSAPMVLETEVELHHHHHHHSGAVASLQESAVSDVVSVADYEMTEFVKRRLERREDDEEEEGAVAV